MTEDLSPRGFYRTMRYIFRDLEDPDSLAAIPFFDNASFADEKLEERLNTCAEHFWIARLKEYYDRLSHNPRGRIPPGHGLGR
jgi:hypothetical protein